MKLPNWTENELILTLDLYFKIKRGEQTQSSAILNEMSKKLRNLIINKDFVDDPVFRNKNGISRKLGNFAAIDPNNQGKGLFSYSKLDKEIFMRYFENQIELIKAVNSIENTNLSISPAKLQWTEEELILVLALYKELTYGQMHGRNAKVIAMSNLLRSLPIHDIKLHYNNFRSAASISLRLSNYRSCDPKCNSNGLRSSGKGLFKEIFTKYSNNDEQFYSMLSCIVKKYKIDLSKIISRDFVLNNISLEQQPIMSNFQIHKNKETSSTFLNKVKNYYSRKSISCSICNIDLNKIYGKLGEDAIEYHCIKKNFINNSYNVEVSIGDYIQVCPSCHKILDKFYGKLDYNDLKAIIKNE
ncbi:MAG: hypothetical protein CVT93_05130 [Bacteroidetes bacterium HGW-Bacteroidetes-10]|nr:MAG: hypothetical protein CVT93_05130 [Bacteroidetes bacterium HGW-Bacteroidetes-10]